MDKTFKIILKGVIFHFFSLFFIISSIISLVYIVTISNLTSKIEVSFIELLKFYILSLPQIILITISISIFIAIVNFYTKLSETQELVSFFALGFSPKKLLFPSFSITIVLLVLNLLILFVSIPYAKIAFQNLKYKKLQEAKFNFKSSQVSQQFGNWLIFAKKDKNNNFSNIYLFSPNNLQFITAKNSILNHKNYILVFNLFKGSIYDLNKTYKIDFKKLIINQKIPTINFSFKDYLTYFKKEFIKYFPIALLPLSLFFFIPLISFFHPRINKKNTLLLTIAILSIYGTISLINKNLIFAISLPFIFFITGGILYKWKVKF